MVEAHYDLVILGASGFTGKYVVKEALKYLQNSISPTSPLKTIALAGRNPAKLEEALKWALSNYHHGFENTSSSILIIKADVSDPSSLRDLCSKTKLMLNCVGPFSLYGEPVVSTCIEVGCDYLDVCGEPEFMEKMEAINHHKAVENGSLVISACAFHSAIAEMGLMFHSQQWLSPAVPNQVEVYMSVESNKRIVVNFGSLRSSLLIVSNAEKLLELRKSRPKIATPMIPGPLPPKGPLIEIRKKVGLWAVKLPLADSLIYRRTLETLTENPHGLPGVNESDEHIQKRKNYWSTVKPSHIKIMLGSKSILDVLRFIMVGMIISLFGRLGLIGRWLLLKFPSVFTLGCFRKEGPTEVEVENASFKMWFVGQGYSSANLAAAHKENGGKPDTEIITRVMGPEAGYLTTPIILLQCALVVLSQRGDLPKGGIFPPGTVFGPTDLQDRLQHNGISFDVISKNVVSS